MLARVDGQLTGLPMVVLRIASLMNSLLGATERLFMRAFATLEAMAPCIVFIDETEKAFADSGSETDGGAMMRVTGSLLSWINDNPHPNYIIATCNSLGRMGEIGETMTRSGRFDAIFFLDVPDARARRAIWTQALTREPLSGTEIAAIPVVAISVRAATVFRPVTEKRGYRARSYFRTAQRDSLAICSLFVPGGANMRRVSAKCAC